LIIQTEHPQIKAQIVFLQQVWFQQTILKRSKKFKKTKFLKYFTETKLSIAYALVYLDR